MKKIIMLCLLAAHTTYATPTSVVKVYTCSSAQTQTESLEITVVNNQLHSFQEISTLPFSQTSVKGPTVQIDKSVLRKDGSIEFKVGEYYTLTYTAVVSLAADTVLIESYDNDEGELLSEALFCTVKQNSL